MRVFGVPSGFDAGVFVVSVSLGTHFLVVLFHFHLFFSILFLQTFHLDTLHMLPSFLVWVGFWWGSFWFKNSVRFFEHWIVWFPLIAECSFGIIYFVCYFCGWNREEFSARFLPPVYQNPSFSTSTFGERYRQSHPIHTWGDDVIIWAQFCRLVMVSSTYCYIR